RDRTVTGVQTCALPICNRVSSMLTGLATDIEDPVERLRLISAGTRQAKDQDKAIGADTLTDWTEFAAPALAARAARLYSRTKVEIGRASCRERVYRPEG